MKNNTITAAIALGFDFSQFDNETELSEINTAVLQFLDDNCNKLPQEFDECEISGSGFKQYVNHGDFSSSGEIIDWLKYYHSGKRTKVEHSNYVYIKDDGTPILMTLWCWAGTDLAAE